MTKFITLKEFPLWDKMLEEHIPFGFDIELTARCNLNCRHCYINLPSHDPVAKASEMDAAEILDISRQAVELGAVWCLVTGGEPLLRPDFAEIYLGLKRLGLLITVFTNATLVGPEHVTLFQKYPPRDLEVTMYGASDEIYDRITSRPGSFQAFKRGLERLIAGGLKVRLKAMALRSNSCEMENIADFCRKYTKDYYRFDPVLHLRLDRNETRNREIIAERLSPSEIVALERADPERSRTMDKHCDHYILPERDQLDFEKCQTCVDRNNCEKYEKLSSLLSCEAGKVGFSVSYESRFRLCQSLNVPGTTYDLRQGTVREAWEKFIPYVRGLKTSSNSLLSSCKSCQITNLCLNCPAHAWLESGNCDTIVQYFCDVAHMRKEGIKVS